MSLGGAQPGQPIVPVVASIEVDERDLAHRIAGAMNDLLEPAPSALSLFEQAGDQAHGTTTSKPVRWRIDAYYDSDPDGEGIARSLSDILGCDVPSVSVEPVPDENWVALSQAALPPVEAGGFTVHGSHDRGRVALGPNAIEIDAGEAFGTAHHATTYGCLEALSGLMRRRAYRNVLDLGTGSGLLAIAVQRRLPRARIAATDIDVQSCVVARENLKVNRLPQRIPVVVANGLTNPVVRSRKPFDLLIANILAGPLIMLAKDIGAAVRPGGTVVLSGLLVPQSRQVIATYRAAGFSVCEHRRIAGWSTLVLTRRACLGQRTGPANCKPVRCC